MKNGVPTNIPPFFNPQESAAAPSGVQIRTPIEPKNPITEYNNPISSFATNDVTKDLIAAG
jgi:hypothetical protein